MRRRSHSRPPQPDAFEVNQILTSRQAEGQPILISVSEAASILGVGKRTVESMISIGRGNSDLPRLRTVRLGRRVLIPFDEILTVVARLKADAGWRTK